MTRRCNIRNTRYFEDARASFDKHPNGTLRSIGARCDEHLGTGRGSSKVRCVAPATARIVDAADRCWRSSLRVSPPGELRRSGDSTASCWLSFAPATAAYLLLRLSTRRFQESSRHRRTSFLRFLAASATARAPILQTSAVPEYVERQSLVELEESFPGSYFSFKSDNVDPARLNRVAPPRVVICRPKASLTGAAGANFRYNTLQGHPQAVWRPVP